MKTRVSSPYEPHEACIGSHESLQLSSLCRGPSNDPSLSSYRPRFARSDRGERSEMGGEDAHEEVAAVIQAWRVPCVM